MCAGTGMQWPDLTEEAVSLDRIRSSAGQVKWGFMIKYWTVTLGDYQDLRWLIFDFCPKKVQLFRLKAAVVFRALHGPKI